MGTFITLVFGVLMNQGNQSALDRLVLSGPELHPELVTRQLGGKPIRHVRTELIESIPQVSRDPEFVRSIGGSGSQGNLKGEGVVAALYALYDGENELGFYGFEAESEIAADGLEADLRHIWRKNVAGDRAQIHRHGELVLVIWTDGMRSDVWQQVNRVVANRINQ